MQRREFLKSVGAATGTLLLSSGTAATAQAEDASPQISKGVLVDLTKCIGCGWCQEACSQANGLPAESIDDWSAEQGAPPLSANTWTVVMLREREVDGRTCRVFALSASGVCVGLSCECAGKERVRCCRLRCCPVYRLPLLYDGLPLWDSQVRMGQVHTPDP
jgi:Fe-S-cluster-containing dehydrogenase component